MKDLSFAIIGAGVGGLAAGLALQRAGFRVAIYEQAPQLSKVGAGLSLSPTAAHSLNHLGLKSVLDATTCRPEVECIRHFKDATPLVWINRGQLLVEQYGERYYTIHRADLHDGLKSAVRANDTNCIHR
jgi:salicylate hydroxylase